MCELFFQVTSTTQDLFEQVIKYLGLTEKFFFGLTQLKGERKFQNVSIKRQFVYRGITVWCGVEMIVTVSGNAAFSITDTMQVLICQIYIHTEQNAVTWYDFLLKCSLIFSDGEHIFLDLDVKLAKYAPVKWKEEVILNF